MHSSNPGYIRNDHWCVCDLCGFDYRRSEMRTTYDGKNVCEKDWESRHPQELLRAKKDDMSPIGIHTGSPQPEFVSVTYLDTDADDIPSSTFNPAIL